MVFSLPEEQVKYYIHFCDLAIILSKWHRSAHEYVLIGASAAPGNNMQVEIGPTDCATGARWLISRQVMKIS